MKRKIFSLIGLLSFVLGSSVLHAMISDRDLQIHFGITSASEEHRTFWRALLDGDDALMRQYCDSLVFSGRTAQEEELIWGQLSDFMDTRIRGGDTPLMIAVRQENLPLVRVLKDYGASSCLRNDRGQSAHDMALTLLASGCDARRRDRLEQIRYMVGFAGGGGGAVAQEESFAACGNTESHELASVSVPVEKGIQRKHVRFAERVGTALATSETSDSDDFCFTPYKDRCLAQETEDLLDLLY